MSFSRHCVFVLSCILIASLGGAAGVRTNETRTEFKPHAASFPQTLSVEVSGSPALGSSVLAAIQGAIRTRLATADGASIAFDPLNVTDVGAGITRKFSVPVRVSAPESLQSMGAVTVTVRNLGLAKQDDGILWYSNDPESVVRPGPLFSSTLHSGVPARLLYHHINASQQGMYLRVQAVNDSDQTARLFIIPGDSAPDRNPVRAGLHAADQYIRAWMWGSGEVVTIPPHATLPISLRRLLPGETMSGLCSLRLVSGPKDLQVRTDAWPLFEIDKRWEAATWSPTPWRFVGTNPMNDYDTAPYEPSARVFPNPFRDASLSYQVGGRFGIYRIGQLPIASQDDEQRLEGNFGVVYRIQTELSNPNSAPADVEITFEASAGYSGAVFIVNGKYLTTSLLQPKEQERVALIHLNPGEKRNFVVTTVPLSGGSYPATITARPVQSVSASSRH